MPYELVQLRSDMEISRKLLELTSKNIVGPCLMFAYLIFWRPIFDSFISEKNIRDFIKYEL